MTAVSLMGFYRWIQPDSIKTADGSVRPLYDCRLNGRCVRAEAKTSLPSPRQNTDTPENLELQKRRARVAPTKCRNDGARSSVAACSAQSTERPGKKCLVSTGDRRAAGGYFMGKKSGCVSALFEVIIATSLP
jgi:hypothetical protein